MQYLSNSRRELSNSQYHNYMGLKSLQNYSNFHPHQLIHVHCPWICGSYAIYNLLGLTQGGLGVVIYVELIFQHCK